MRTWHRIAVFVAVMALVASACTGAATPAPPTAASATAAAPTTAPATAAGPTAAPPTAAGPTTPPETAAPETSAPQTVAPATEGPATEAPSSEAPASEGPAPSVTPVPTIGHAGAQSAAPGVTLIRWFCCLGAGDAPNQAKAETKIVNDFNATHDKVQISLEIVPYALAFNQLATEIASTNPPDIVGPVGYGGANAFGDQWLDLAPLIQSHGYDMSQYPQGANDYWKFGDQQLGIPFAIYPSMLWYQRDAFSEIGLEEPPHQWGAPYHLDGQEVPWDYDTLKEVAKRLTVDKNNVDASQAGFDPTQIQQWGYEPQRDDLRGLGAFYGAGQLSGGTDGTTVQIPEQWAAAWKDFYDGIWTDHSIETYSDYQSTSIDPQGKPFCSGNVAMAVDFLWSTYCVGAAGTNWDVAALPSYQDKTTAAFNADTFRIMKSTQHPDEAFDVVSYLLSGDVAKKLLNVYGAMPARPEQQDAFFKSLTESFTDADGKPITLDKPVDWQVAKDGVQYADSPNFESLIPAYNQSLDLFTKYSSKWQATQGLDMDSEIEALKNELQGAWDQDK